MEKEQLCYFISGVMRRIHGIPLDKAGDRSFKYMSPENRAEKDAMDSMKPQLKRRRSYAGHRHHRSTNVPHGLNREARSRKTEAGRSEA